ncbi:MAG: DNA polymerase III subunit delta' [Candidatus Omnitrophica bacterium]|nr:DNA polymerase III subunit delta' [Candidatus Omnitrophota bacterium]
MNTVSVDPRILERFKRLVASSRMGHAYLFVGPKETGKTQTALGVAQLVNCESSEAAPCGICPSCQKIASRNHPDVMVVNQNEGSIKIDQIRSLLGRLQLKAYEAKTKVFIIRDVENMTLEAANSLLKTLEEPASNTLMILTTATPESNLDTIRSRCHVVKFFPVSKNRLQETLNVSPDVARLLTVYTDGCLGQSRILLEEDFISRKNKILDAFLKSSNEDALKKLSSEKEEAREALHVFLSMVRDAILFKSGVAAIELMHVDRLLDVQSLAGRPYEELAAIYNQVIKTKQLLDENLNAKMGFSILRQRIWQN